MITLLSLLAFSALCSAQDNITSSSSSAAPLLVDSGDTAWMLTSSALVFFMTPGLAFFYGGLVRAQFSLNTLLMSYVCLGLITVHWVVFGYTFAFAPGSMGFGSFEWIGLRHVGLEPDPDYAATIPHLLYMVYQLMFAIITPAIISGALVERMSFKAYVIFILIWATIVYDTIAHWVWSAATQVQDDGTTFVQLGWIRHIGALDFAGGTVVHMSSGYSALVACIIVGKRKDFDCTKPSEPHNVPFVLLGAAILWFGWFGFNGGSALASNELAALAFTNTQIATGTAFLTWVLLDAFVKKKVTATGAASGAVVGLVAITPAAGFVPVQTSLAFGAIGVLGVYGVLELKLRYSPKLFPQLDDSLDVFCCHGIGGTIGCFLVGFFASTDVNSAGANGVFFGGGILLAYQLAAIGITIALSCFVTAAILLVMRMVMELTNEHDDGLDLKLHGVNAYDFMNSSPTEHRPEEANVIPLSPRTTPKSPVKTV